LRFFLNSLSRFWDNVGVRSQFVDGHSPSSGLRPPSPVKREKDIRRGNLSVDGTKNAKVELFT